jgi:integrase
MASTGKRRKKRTIERGISAWRGGYRVRITYNGHQYFIGTYDTLADARGARDIARSQCAVGTFVPPTETRRRARQAERDGQAQKLTVREWVEQWLTLPAQSGRNRGKPPTDSTVRTRRSSLTAHVLDTLGDIALVDVTPDQVAAILAGIDHPSARRNAGLAMRAMFNAAVKQGAGGLAVSPFREEVGAHQRSDTPGRFQMITPAQVVELTAAMPERLALVIPMATWCDMRKGEILGLQRRDFTRLDDPKHASVHIERQWLAKATPADYGPPKAGSARTVALPAAMVPAVVDHLDRFTGPSPEAPVFPSSRTPEHPASPNTLDVAWDRARRGIADGLRLHDLRAVGLTLYARAGATTADLMARGGHRDVGVAMRYQRDDPARDREVTDRMNTIIRGENT